MIPIYVWPSGVWCYEQNLKMNRDSNGEGELRCMIPKDLDNDDIAELIELNALPGMLPDVINISGIGPIPIPKKDMLVITFDENETHVVVVEGKYIITGPSTVVESKKAI